MHVPQNIVAEVELSELAATHQQIVSPANNSPIIGVFQDSLLGAFRFTRSKLLFTAKDAMQFLMLFPFVNVAKLRESMNKNGGYISNFDIISQILPPMTLNYESKFGPFEIQNGTFIQGMLDKAAVNGGTKGLIHQIFNVFGPTTTYQFIDHFQSIITEYMKQSSYSVGISDLIASHTTYEAIANIIETKKNEVYDLISQVHMGIFKNVSSHSNIYEFELRVKQCLEDARSKTESEAKKSLSPENRFLFMVTSGSKASLVNITQMIACLGQQDVDGKRIPYGFDSRTLPHFSKYDDSATARGFIENSYISGLTSQELFFHAMAGRIGLIDTAVKTSQTGYIQRRLMKALEDLKVEYDMTVRNSMHKIIQFRYGDDGFDSIKVESQNVSLVSRSVDEIYNHYSMIGMTKDKKAAPLTTLYTKEAAKRFKSQLDKLKPICKEWTDYMIDMRDKMVQRVFQYKNESSVNTPVGFAFLIANIQGQLALLPDAAIDITPLEAFELLDLYFEKISSMVFSRPTDLFRVMYYYYLSPRELLEKKRFHKKALILLLETVYLKYRQALVHPGEKVGVIAGQSVGEPTTQLTLNTFHFSGVASKSNVTRGVPRLEEILRLTDNPKNPSMTIYLKELERDSQEKANYLSTMIAHTRLADVVQNMEICFDPHDESTNVSEDARLLERFYEFERQMVPDNLDNEQVTKSKWIIRLEMDREKMLDKNITMDDVHFAIKNSYTSNDIHCIFADFNMDKLVIRLRVNNSVFRKNTKRGAKSLDKTDDLYMLKDFQDNLLNNIILRGITGIENVFPRKLTNVVSKINGKYVEKKDVWILDTVGTNLLDTLALDYIDPYNTFSNDIKEVFDVLGIEAARQTIYNEFNDVMSFSGVYINHHHLSLLCDRMTCNKCLVAVFRSGILKDNIGPLAKATFEVHAEVLLDAARHAQFDPMRGVSANVMCGQYGYYGTNSFQLLLDLEKFKETKQFKSSNRTMDIETALEMQDEGACSMDRIRITSDIHNVASVVPMSADNYNIGF